VVHRKVRDARLDHAHKTALRLVRDNQAAYAEDLCVAGLARTRLAKSVADAGWSQHGWRQHSPRGVMLARANELTQVKRIAFPSAI
jgi:hypothetical protein